MKKIIITFLLSLIFTPVVFAQMKAGKQDALKHTILNNCGAKQHHVDANPATCPFCGMDLNVSLKEQMKLQATKAYSCPLNAGSASVSTLKKSNLSLKEIMKLEVVKRNKGTGNFPKKEFVVVE